MGTGGRIAWPTGAEGGRRLPDRARLAAGAGRRIAWPTGLFGLSADPEFEESL